MPRIPPTGLSVFGRHRCEGDPRLVPEAGVAKPSDSRGRTKWVDQDILLLKELVRSGTPTGAIALKLGRTKAAISIKASKLGIKLGETTPAEPIEVELKMLENDIKEFAALHPKPNEWTPQQVADYDSLTRRHTRLRAEIAELVLRRAHKQP